MQQEELAQLFSNSLILSQTPVKPSPAPLVEPPQQAVEEQTPAPPTQRITYISQHYYHPTYIAPKPQPEPPAPTSTHIEASELRAIFSRNGIDPTLLFPTQITLFQNADDDQRLRLLELWRISPPEYGSHGHAQDLGNWPETSLHQEEAMAKLRYERLMEKQKQGTLYEPQQQEKDMEQSVYSDTSDDMKRNAEPYMLSGYEQLIQRDYEEQSYILSEPRTYKQAVDPVYQTSTGMWEKTGLQNMENQYGAFQQMREYGAHHSPACNIVGYADEEMVM